MLTFSAGTVDIVGYIGVYHWFVAHMTGDAAVDSHKANSRHSRLFISKFSIFIRNPALGRGRRPGVREPQPPIGI
jgi:uncharacterized membrane protein YoaK (UPF0700 family)